MTQNPYDGAKELLSEIVEQYETMFVQFAAMRETVAEAATKNPSLLLRYSELLEELGRKAVVEFAPLRNEIAHLSENTQADALISKFPPVSKLK